MSRPEGEGGDIFGTMLANDKDVMLAVTTGARLSFGVHNYGFHGDDHSRFQFCVDILAQFNVRLSTVVMAKNTKGMTVAKRSILQEIMSAVDLVQFRCDILASCAGRQQFEASFIYLGIDFPQAQLLVAGVAAEKSAF